MFKTAGHLTKFKVFYIIVFTFIFLTFYSLEHFRKKCTTYSNIYYVTVYLLFGHPEYQFMFKIQYNLNLNEPRKRIIFQSQVGRSKGYYLLFLLLNQPKYNFSANSK